MYQNDFGIIRPCARLARQYTGDAGAKIRDQGAEGDPGPTEARRAGRMRRAAQHDSRAQGTRAAAPGPLRPPRRGPRHESRGRHPHVRHLPHDPERPGTPICLDSFVFHL